MFRVSPLAILILLFPAGLDLEKTSLVEIRELAWSASLVGGVILPLALGLLAAHFLLAQSMYDQKGSGFCGSRSDSWSVQRFRFSRGALGYSNDSAYIRP